MARTKYKLGQFVKVGASNDAAESYGLITEIRTTRDGTSYKLDTLDEAVIEEEIATAYRECTPRKTRAPKSTRSKKRAAAETHTAA